MQSTQQAVNLLSRAFATLALPWALAAAVLGCSEAVQAGSSAELDLPFGDGGGLFEGTDAAGAADSTGDGGDVDPAGSDATASCPGRAYCPCQSNADCDGDFCIESPNGKVCASVCVQTCKDGWACNTVQSPGGDLVSVCTSRWGRLCDPCATANDCKALGVQGALCLDLGADGGFCGAPCQTDGDCPITHRCQPMAGKGGGQAKQCAPAAIPGNDDAAAGCSCSQRAVEEGLQTSCSVDVIGAGGAVVGTCHGVRACAAAGLSSCQAPPGTAETCNGLDDDCDGKTDDLACDDLNPCTSDLCKPGAGGSDKGCSHVQGAFPCDADLNACTEGDACKDGTCTPGSAKVCDDSNPCTLDTCDPAAGCKQLPDENKPCSDENPCTVGDLCKGGQCAPGVPKACSGDNACNLAACNAATGSCGLQPKPTGTACDDGSACTTGDACSGGACVGTAGPCDDGDPCTTGDACVQGVCQGSAIGAGCDDGNACTQDGCDPITKACKHTPNAAACDDGNACTAGDVCSGGGCKPGPAACTLGQPCKSAGDCKDGACQGGVCQKSVQCRPIGKPASPTLGKLSLGSGAVIDTTAGTITLGDQTLVAAGAAGVELHDQGGGSPKLRVFHVESFTIPLNATVKVQGAHGLVIAATSGINISGTLVAKGSAGAGGQVNAGGTPGVAGPGGGAGGGFTSGPGCTPGNGDGKGPGGGVRGACGGPGSKGGEGVGGPGGGGGGGGCGGTGGPGGSHAEPGESGYGGEAGGPASKGHGGAMGPGGSAGGHCSSNAGTTSPSPPYGDDAVTALFGGSGGGAGGMGGFAGFGGTAKGNDASAAGGTPGFSGGSGGGGGGGGVVALCGGGEVYISGVVDVSGGSGGIGGSSGGAGTGGMASVIAKQACGGGGGSGRSGGGGGGGGGAGGTIFVSAAKVVTSAGTLTAAGGQGLSGGYAFDGGGGGSGKNGGLSGGAGGAGGKGGNSGKGSAGRIRVEAGDAQLGVVVGKLSQGAP